MNFDLDFYKGKKVFVTGHTGFKGSWLCKMLANAGAIVTGYSLNPPTKVNVKNILLNSVAVVFVTLSYYFNITILNVAALVIACIYAVGINWKLIKMFFAEIRKYKKEGN